MRLERVVLHAQRRGPRVRDLRTSYRRINTSGCPQLETVRASIFAALYVKSKRRASLFIAVTTANVRRGALSAALRAHLRVACATAKPVDSAPRKQREQQHAKQAPYHTSVHHGLVAKTRRCNVRTHSSFVIGKGLRMSHRTDIVKPDQKCQRTLSVKPFFLSRRLRAERHNEFTSCCERWPYLLGFVGIYLSLLADGLRCRDLP